MVTSICLHPHKPYQLLSSSIDGTVKIWAVDDGVLMKNIIISNRVYIYGLKGKAIKQTLFKYLNLATSKAIHLIYGNEKSKESVDYGRIGFPNEDEKEATREIEGLLTDCLILDTFRLVDLHIL